MSGKHHVQVNIGLLSSGLAFFGSSMKSPVHWISTYFTSCLSVFLPEDLSYLGNWRTNSLVFLGLALFCFWFGSLLPDVDSSKSYLGRYFYLPVEHRRITHTYWALGVLALLWPIHVCFKWLWMGYFLHILGDAFSYAGIVWIYPLKKYKEYANGGFVAPDHKWKCYRVSRKSKSELRFVVLILLACILWNLVFGVMFGGYRQLWKWTIY